MVYAYDNGGTILTKTEYPYSPTVEDITTLTPTNTVTYTYGNADWKDQLTSFNGEAITYDAIGNPLTYRGMTLTWQNGRQLATLSKEGLNVSYGYNDEGLRTQKTVNSVTTEYYWNGSQLLGQKTGSSLLYFLYDERGLLVGFNDGTKTYLYTRNLQGDIIAITDTATETVVATYTYDSWGNVLTATGTMAEVNPFRYRGYYYDAETSLYYLQSRYYDAEVGRFINADAYVFTGKNIVGFNMYTYCLNNPINRIDDGGEESASLLLFYRWEMLNRSKYILGKSKNIVKDVYDEKYFVPKSNGTRIASVDARLMERLQDMGEYYGMENIVITSGYRSYADQERLYQKYLAGKGNLAAKAGSSWHNWGGAVDIHSEFLEGLSNAAFEEFGLIRTVEGEPWHVQIIETRGLKASKYGKEYFNEITKWDKGK